MALNPDRLKAVENGFVDFLSSNRVASALSRPEIATLIAACDGEIETFLNVTLPAQLATAAPGEAGKADPLHLDTLLRLIADERWKVSNNG